VSDSRTFVDGEGTAPRGEPGSAAEPTVEAQVLDLAVRRGYLTLDEVQAAPVRWGPRITALIGAGLLSEAVAEQLVAEVRDEAEGLGSPREPADAGQQRYTIGDLIGQGGMGTVHRAYDESLKRPVALKFLRSDDPDLVQRFLREAQVQARLDHENVCRVYEVGQMAGRPYIAMQLIEGEPLLSAVRMSVEEKVRMLQQVAEAIHAAHREGLVHSDVKP